MKNKHIIQFPPPPGLHLLY